MFLKSNVVGSFIALHEGSIQGEKMQPVIELYPQEKYPWFGHGTGKHKEDLSVVVVLIDSLQLVRGRLNHFPGIQMLSRWSSETVYSTEESGQVQSLLIS